MKRVLPVIVVSQFLCTSLWFAGNAVLPDLVKASALTRGLLAHLTSAVQFGFITGTLMFAIMTVSDRFRPSKVFFTCAILAGVSNLAILMVSIQAETLLLFRFLTGFFLAGIYPVGMKIAADHYSTGLGRSLGFLVGALVLGTAFPHLLNSLTASFKWEYVLYSTSALSVLGGLGMLLLVPEGPYRKRGQGLDLTAFLKVFKIKQFRSASIGYFGHMWELYSFWAFVPIMLEGYDHYPGANINVPFMSFLVISSGGLACILSGIVSQRFGIKRTATIALFLSCICCISSPFFLFNSSVFLFEAFLIFWGLVVIADSPLFSTLIAQNAPAESRGTSLTIVNCIGFSITIVSIQVINWMSGFLSGNFIYLLLAIGPVTGLAALLKDDFFAVFKRQIRVLSSSKELS